MSQLPCRVLVADDDPTVRLLMQAALAPPEFKVTAVEDGLAAMAAFQLGTFDIVLLDIEMQGMDGFELGAAIRATHAALPVMMVTGHCDPAFVEKIRAMAADHIVKPVNWQTLAQCLRDRLSRV